MPTRCILVNFNGCPSTMDSLTPDSGLANLAGSLIADGHEALILDYATVDIIGRLVPDVFCSQLNDLLNECITDMLTNGELSIGTIDRLNQLDRELEDHKHKQIEDIAEEISNIYLDMGANFIGFKLWTGDGFDGSSRIAAYIRKKIPNAKIFGGGPHVDWFKENILTYTDAFDAIAYGEGEETIQLLAKYVEDACSLKEIPNIIYKENGKIVTTLSKMVDRLDTVADPVYDVQRYPAMKGDQKIKFIMLEESRGCPNSCHFCIHPNKSGSRWRRRDPRKTVDLLEKLKQQLNTNAFRFTGSNTPADLKKSIASEILRRNTNIRFSAFGHAKQSAKEDYGLLRKSGCVSLAFGVESGSQYILDNDINKRVHVSQIVKALKDCKQAGIHAVASIIIPFPHDTEETIKETLQLLTDTRPAAITIQLPALIPHTYWFNNRDKFGFELDKDYMDRVMTYRIRSLLPPHLWDPFPYKINGRTHLQSVKTAYDFSKELSKNGLLDGIGDFLLFIGCCLEMPLRELRDLNRKLFFTSDFRAIQNLVSSFNQKVSIR